MPVQKPATPPDSRQKPGICDPCAIFLPRFHGFARHFEFSETGNPPHIEKPPVDNATILAIGHESDTPKQRRKGRFPPMADSRRPWSGQRAKRCRKCLETLVTLQRRVADTPSPTRYGIKSPSADRQTHPAQADPCSKSRSPLPPWSPSLSSNWPTGRNSLIRRGHIGP